MSEDNVITKYKCLDWTGVRPCTLQLYTGNPEKLDVLWSGDSKRWEGDTRCFGVVCTAYVRIRRRTPVPRYAGIRCRLGEEAKEAVSAPGWEAFGRRVVRGKVECVHRLFITKAKRTARVFRPRGWRCCRSKLRL